MSGRVNVTGQKNCGANRAVPEAVREGVATWNLRVSDLSHPVRGAGGVILRPRHGFGLFLVDKSRNAGDIIFHAGSRSYIVEYFGREVRRVQDDNDYYVFNGRGYIDANGYRSSVGRYANDARFTIDVDGNAVYDWTVLNNAYLDVDNHTVVIRAWHEIRNNDEVTVTYGEEYWRDKYPQLRVVGRQPPDEPDAPPPEEQDEGGVDVEPEPEPEAPLLLPPVPPAFVPPPPPPDPVNLFRFGVVENVPAAAPEPLPPRRRNMREFILYRYADVANGEQDVQEERVVVHSLDHHHNPRHYIGTFVSGGVMKVLKVALQHSFDYENDEDEEDNEGKALNFSLQHWTEENLHASLYSQNNDFNNRIVRVYPVFAAKRFGDETRVYLAKVTDFIEQPRRRQRAADRQAREAQEQQITERILQYIRTLPRQNELTTNPDFSRRHNVLVDENGDAMYHDFDRNIVGW